MTKKEYRTDKDAPSSIFIKSISGSGYGSSRMTCGWCDRHHLCLDGHIHDEDPISPEFRNYCEEEKKKNPDGVVLHYDVDGIIGSELNGILFVTDCPCNGLSRFEKFIWDNRNKIRSYLKVRIEHEYGLAQQELTLNKLAGFDSKDPKVEGFWWD